MGDVGEHPYTAHGPGYARCMEIMKKAGASFASDSDRLYAVLACDGYGFLKAAVEAGLPSITAASFIIGAERLGAGFPGAASYAVSFGPGRHYGVAAVRISRFDEACTCFKYTSGLRSIL